MNAEYTTTKGATVAIDQLYRDARETNVRTLRIDNIRAPYSTDRPDECQVDYTVVLVDGEPLAKPRSNNTTAKRLTSRDFRLLTGDALAVAQSRIAEGEPDHA